MTNRLNLAAAGEEEKCRKRPGIACSSTLCGAADLLCAPSNLLAREVPKSSCARPAMAQRGESVAASATAGGGGGDGVAQMGAAEDDAPVGQSVTGFSDGEYDDVSSLSDDEFYDQAFPVSAAERSEVRG